MFISTMWFVGENQETWNPLRMGLLKFSESESRNDAALFLLN